MPTDLEVAMDLARAYERLSMFPPVSVTATTSSKAASTKPFIPRTAASMVSASGSTAPSTITTGASGSIKPFRRLTSTEMEEHHGMGLCHNYDEKFVPGH